MVSCCVEAEHPGGGDGCFVEVDEASDKVCLFNVCIYRGRRRRRRRLSGYFSETGQEERDSVLLVGLGLGGFEFVTTAGVIRAVADRLWHEGMTDCLDCGE